MDTLTYEPAWAYARRGWPPATWLGWTWTGNGDELTLDLPPGLIGITVWDDAGLEALAWLEAQKDGPGPLPPTWTTRPSKSRFGTRIYQVTAGLKFRQRVTEGVAVTLGGIPVWPSPADGGDRWTWFDPQNIPLLDAPDHREFALLGSGKWPTELHVTSEPCEPVTPNLGSVLDRFLQQTFVAAGPEHRMTTADIFAIYGRWLDVANVPLSWRAKDKGTLGRLLADRGYGRWDGRTPDGFRRGFDGLRFPDGAWND